MTESLECSALLPFAKKLLTDLATRRDSRGNRLQRGRRREEIIGGEKRPVFLNSPYICYLPAIEGKSGTRASDATLRLSLAVTACEMYLRKAAGTTTPNRQACLMVAGFLISSPSLPLRTLYLKGIRGRRPKTSERSFKVKTAANEKRVPRFLEIEAAILAEKERHRAPTSVDRLVRVIANTVRKYRVAHPAYLATFETWLLAFKSAHWRDADWYRLAQRHFDDSHSAKAALAGGPSVKLTYQLPAMEVSAHANNLHQQGRFEEALAFYRIAISLWENVSKVAGERRAQVLERLKEERQYCARESQDRR